ncbi:hypothetical protein A2U01_0075180, partial [Trifolium medium]|nr:hypothetical protein [Trifolium medium]
VKARYDAIVTTLNTGETGSDVSNVSHVPVVDLADTRFDDDNMDAGVVHFAEVIPTEGV